MSVITVKHSAGASHHRAAPHSCAHPDRRRARAGGRAARARRPRRLQVHFVERDLDRIAIGGILLADMPEPADVMMIDVAVRDADWSREPRAEVIGGMLVAQAEATGLDAPAPGWWVNFRVIDDGSWASSGGVVSILDLLDTGVFSTGRGSAISQALGA